MKLIDKFPSITKLDEPLSNHSTFKIGGPAEVFVAPETGDQLIEVLRFVVDSKLPYIIIGGGSNVLFPDEGIKGVVISPANKQIKIGGIVVKAGAGAVLAQVAAESCKSGLSGLQWGIGVPGSVGGAIRGNAGCFGGEIKDSLIEVTVFDGKEVKIVDNDQMNFAYRSSRIKNNPNEVVIDASFKLEPCDPEECQAKMKEVLDKKFATQPFGELTAGCMFKNVNLDGPRLGMMNPDILLDKIPAEFVEKGLIPAAWLIDQLGLKGYEKDGVKVSEKHANFIVNTGEGSAKAVKEMVEFIKKRVYDAYKLKLEEEVEMLHSHKL